MSFWKVLKAWAATAIMFLIVYGVVVLKVGSPWRTLKLAILLVLYMISVVFMLAATLLTIAYLIDVSADFITRFFR